MDKRSKKSSNANPTSSEAATQMIQYFAAQLAASRVSDAVDAAQEIMFDAWECEDPRKRISMARKALKVSGDCADAYVLLAEEGASTLEEAIALYAQGVAAGERALGSAAFQDDVGMFWGLLETRPYMRARLGFALALWDAGRTDDAVGHGEAMLHLNPNDNQGVRYVVPNWLQQLGRDADADGLLRRYKDDCGNEWAWSVALAAFRRNGDRAPARKALTRATQANPHVAAYLLGQKKLPKAMPAYVEMGGEEEAAAYVEAAAATWRMTPGTLEWLSIALPTTASGPPSRGRRPT